MIMMKKKYEKQKGVALLFAIGILSLLMITGLAFVTNSVLSRKTAYNNRSRTQAKMLAQSAISRSMLAIMVQQYKMNEDSEWPSEFSKVYSYAKYDDDGKETAPASGTAYSDQLTGEKSLIKFPHWKYSSDEYKDLIKDEKYKDRAKWVFLYDSSDVGKRKIIGRIAYQVLPPGKEQLTINMSAALSGSKPDPTNEKYPFKQRLGVGVEELNFDSVKAISNPDTWSSIFGLTAAGEVAPELYSTLYGMLGIDASATERRNWIEGWLSEGGNLVEPEVFVGGKEQTRYYRFNISQEGEAWKDRFSASAENSDNRIDEIVSGGKKYHFLTSEKSAKGGIPFFKRIGSDAEKNASGFGKLENFRRQIVANFNDYCDEDHIPTSDVDATKWDSYDTVSLTSQTGSTVTVVNEPSYTGNEATPYIYEFALRGHLTKLKLDPATRKGFSEVELKLYPAAKLVNIYPQLIQDTPQKYQSFDLNLWLRYVTMTVEVTKVKAKIKYTSHSTSDPTPVEQEREFDFDITGIETSANDTTDGLEKSLYWRFDPTVGYVDEIEGQKIKINYLPADFNNATSKNYAWKSSNSAFTLKSRAGTFSGSKRLLDETTDFVAGSTYLNKLKDQIPTEEIFDEVKSVTNCVVTDAKLKITVWPGRMALMGNCTETDGDGNSVIKSYGVDIVNTPVITNPTSPRWKINLTSPLTELDTNVATNHFVLAGMRCKDPRQNLNWENWDFTFPQGEVYLATDPIPWNNVLNTTGVNQKRAGSNPAYEIEGCIPKISSTAKDIEEAPEPAWKGDAANQHLSTAFIRNAPMRSPWELGLIHRAVPWQTINLKKACSPTGLSAIGPEDHDPIKAKWAESGTSYTGGDGGILNEIKMTDKINSAGKIDLNVLYKLNSSLVSTLALDQDIVKALFVNVPYKQQIAINGSYATPRLFSDLYMEKNTYTTEEESKKAKLTSEDIVTSVNAPLMNVFVPTSPENITFNNRAHFLDKQNDSLTWSNLGGSFSPNTDAAQEEIIGKTINLVDASSEAALPSVIYVQIVAQTIRDIEGTGIVRLKKDGTPMTPVDCSLGKFDARRQSDGSKTLAENGSDNVYYDEITGEVKLLATLIRDPLTGKISLRAIEYID